MFIWSAARFNFELDPAPMAMSYRELRWMDALALAILADDCPYRCPLGLPRRNAKLNLFLEIVPHCLISPARVAYFLAR